MKRKIFSKMVLLSKAIALAGLATTASAVQLDSEVAQAKALAAGAPVTDRIIVKYKDSASASLATASMNRASSTVGIEMQAVRQLATGAQLVHLSQSRSTSDINDVIKALLADPNVEYAEPDLLLQPMATPNDSRYSEQWHYFESTGGLNLPSAWDITQGDGVVVAVIDTGILPHSDLNANLLPGYDMISNTTVSRDGDGRDSDPKDEGDWVSAGECGGGYPPRDQNSSWHGSHVAGTVAAVSNNGKGIAGVAYKSKVVPIRVLGRCGGYTSDIADAIIWGAGGSVSGVPANQNPAQVLNLSLGGTGACSSTQQAAINTARGLGATVVVAAGNSNANASNHNPANCAGVVTVASTNRAGSRSWYSNYGSVVDIAAPGGETSVSANGVLSTLNTGTSTPGSESYAFYQGTSMAAPHVAGAAALMYAVKPSITPDEVETILKNTSRSFPGSCSQCGSGIVDATAAVNEAKDGGGSTGGNELQNNVAVTGLSGSTGSEVAYTMEVPAGASSLTFTMSSGSGDADLYVKYGSAPTTGSYDCRPYRWGNNETCNMSNVRAGTYHVMIRGYNSYSGVSLTGSHN